MPGIRFTLALVACAAGGDALAQSLTLVCESPRGEYVVVFDPATDTFVAEVEEGPTAYAVEAVLIAKSGYVVRGRTVEGGPDFTAFFGLPARIEYSMNGELQQTDACR